MLDRLQRLQIIGGTLRSRRNASNASMCYFCLGDVLRINCRRRWMDSISLYTGGNLLCSVDACSLERFEFGEPDA